MRPASDVLEEVLAAPVRMVTDRGLRPDTKGKADMLLQAGGRTYIIEVKQSGRSASVAAAVFQVEQYRRSLKEGVVPLLYVDHMTPNGAALCAEHEIAWIDADGNADIAVPDLRVRIRGLRAASPSEPRRGFNAFSRAASRVSHALLLSPGRRWTRAALANETGLDKGSLSRAIRALGEQRYLVEERKHRASIITVASWSTLLDAWDEQYRSAPPVAFGLVSSRSGEQTLHDVARRLNELELQPTFSGLPAASHYARFGSFRRVRLYVPQSPGADVLRALNVTDDIRGRNVVISVDEEQARIGRTIGPDGISYVSPVLTYLDLHDEPERSAEAREAVRRSLRDLWSSV